MDEIRYLVFSEYTGYRTVAMGTEEMEEYIRVVRKHFPSATFDIEVAIPA